MSGMSYGDYGKRDNTGKGVSRLAVLLDAIRNGTPIEVSGKGNKVIQFTSSLFLRINKPSLAKICDNYDLFDI